mmetsp:Transcript_55433/g.147107  ORF Transcript_55433/g.147107 Transcript_55433/m.147107 type:complete len:353 (-) Transcript_55433:355-1413(-)
MQLFGGAAHGDFINADANFCTFDVSLLTMFRAATGEAWNGLMHDLMQQPPDHVSLGLGAVPFFVSYVLVSTFIVLKMMIAIILENFIIALKNDGRSLQLEHADAFVEAWAEFDPQATGRLHVRHLVDVMRRLPPPLGLDPSHYKNRMVLPSHIARYVFQMDLHTHRTNGGPPEVYFKELLACLVKDSYHDDDKDDQPQAHGLHLSLQAQHLEGKASRAWGDVLPPADSKLGKQLHDLLSELNIYREDAPSEEGFLGESIAATIIISAWTSKLRNRLVERRERGEAPGQRLRVRRQLPSASGSTPGSSALSIRDVASQAHAQATSKAAGEAAASAGGAAQRTSAPTSLAHHLL